MRGFWRFQELSINDRLTMLLDTIFLFLLYQRFTTSFNRFQERQ
jgi:hypothetical protein